MKIKMGSIENIVTFPTRTCAIAGGIVYETGRILKSRDLKKIGMKTIIYSIIANNYVESYFSGKEEENQDW